MRLRLLIIVSFLLPAVAGCSRGHAALWSQANPQTSFSFNPLTKTVTLFSNDGKGVTVDQITATWGENSFEVHGLVVTDRSVENRQANVQQLQVVDQITKTAIQEIFSGLSGMIEQGLMPLRGASATVDTPIGGGSVKLGGAPTTQPTETSGTGEVVDPPSGGE